MPKAKASSKANGSKPKPTRRRGAPKPAPAPVAGHDEVGAGTAPAVAPAASQPAVRPGMIVRIMAGDWRGSAGRVYSLRGADECLVVIGPRFPLVLVRQADCAAL